MDKNIGELNPGKKSSLVVVTRSDEVDNKIQTSRTNHVPFTYEARLNQDARWALSEGSKHFEESNDVFNALRKITSKLKSLGVDYAVVGGMALFRHGFRRFTEDVDILVSKEDLKVIHKNLRGLGYRPPFEASKNLRDVDYGIKIEFLVTGDYPGDGKQKPVSFPEPKMVSQEMDGINYINLHTLIELKLASGMTSAGRLKDLADVMELIKVLNLPADFVLRLNPFVRDKYKELWKESRRRYVMLWRNKWLTAKAKTIDEMIGMLRGASEELQAMKRDGVFLDAEREGVDDDYAHLVTLDPVVAKKYGMEDEAEIWGEDMENLSDEIEAEAEKENITQRNQHD